MSGDNKMKGLLKGLRIISQIFEEKEQEIEIGNPTDVKHVAHIGWDGPTDNNPSWMNEFKSTPGLSSSGPLNMNGDNHSRELNDWASSDSMKRGSKSLNGEDDTHELPLPKSSSKQQSHSGNMRESHAKEKSDKPRQPKRHSKHSTPNDSFNETKHTSREQSIPKDTDSLQLQGEDANDNLPPKTSHSKKTKDVQGVGGSSKSRSKSQVKESNSKSKELNSNEGTHSRSSSKSKEPNSNEGTHSRSGSKSKEPNSNEVSHSRHSSKSRDSNSNDGSHSRTGSKSKDSNSKEGPHSRSSSKSKDSNSKEGDLTRPNSKPRNKHRLSEEGGQLKRGSNENIMTNYAN
ncbi:CRIB domain-containing protein RIC7 [Trifolium repens]|nr:CRIB domain-containing protein RIC7 [Trifolium repens]